ncbi:MAG: O-antigen ligase domain-containing protein [Nevskiaceae bacterium]|nr:MAG: O-antigen ligase domain-containing protein [Nevskiaceae bacterium]TBR73239.1 MAG: O-antigen ligase domain-containing protein [Nevskiaceae bacterium]
MTRKIAGQLAVRSARSLRTAFGMPDGLPLRLWLASLALVWAVAVPVVWLLWCGRRFDLVQHEVAAWRPFTVLMAPEAVAILWRLRRARVFQAVVVVTGICLFSWLMNQGPFWLLGRFWLYVWLLLFALACAGWAGKVAPALGLRVFFAAKLGMTLFAMALFAAVLVQFGTLHGAFSSPPIFCNIRHFDFALVVVLGVGLAWLGGASRDARGGLHGAAAIALFVAAGYFLVWSGGRGGMLAFGVTWAMLWWRAERAGRRVLHRALGLLAVSAVLVLATGQGEFFLSQLLRMGADSLNAMSSSRLAIWGEALQRWAAGGVPGMLFGYEPDAFFGFGIGRALDPDIVQPHNALIQFLLEFGLAGTAVIVAAWAWLLRRCFRVLRQPHGVDVTSCVAALLVGLSVYAQVDGVLYHVVPLTAVAFLVAWFVRAGPVAARSPAMLGR